MPLPQCRCYCCSFVIGVVAIANVATTVDDVVIDAIVVVDVVAATPSIVASVVVVVAVVIVVAIRVVVDVDDARGC